METKQNPETVTSLQFHLQELHRAMRQLHQSMPAPLPQPAIPLASREMGLGPERRELMEQLVEHVSRYAGFKRDDHLFKKASKRFASLNNRELELRVREILGLPDDHHGLRNLVEDLTVHETYFFRDGNQFNLLRHVVLPDLIQRERECSQPSLRVWSAATSSGEEAYTLLMITLLALQEQGEAWRNRHGEIAPDPRWRLDVLGTDISKRILERARAGIFQEVGSLGSFREMPSELLTFFECDVPTPDWGERGLRYASILPCYRERLRFELHNLAGGIPIDCGFDVILCRNVLIYFDDDVRRKVLEMHWQALKPGGILLLGPPDSMLLEQHFETRWWNGIVYYVKIAS